MVKEVYKDLILVLFAALCVVAAASYILYRLFRRIDAADDLPRKCRGIRLNGIITQVVDGDTIKFYHCPLLRSNNTKRRKKPLVIRLAGIDAPEVAYRRKPGQPLGEVSKAFLADMVLNKKVTIKILAFDIYNRILAFVYLKGWFSDKNVSLKLVKEGMACVYRSKSAEYGKYKKKLFLAEERAIRKKKGIWSLPDFKNPAEFRKKTSQSVEALV